MYDELIAALETIEDAEVLAAAEKQLTRMEEERPELLKPAVPYMLHLPEDRSAAFHACVLGSDGHALAHMIDLLYPNASIWWIANIKLYDDSCNGHMDFLLFSEMTGRQAMMDDGVLKIWGAQTLRSDGRILWKLPTACVELTDLYNLCNFSGFAVDSVDSNHLVVVRKDSLIIQGIGQKQRYGKIYALCPSSCKSGGAELLHQLVCQINSFGGDAAIAYVSTQSHTVYCHPEYADYAAGSIVRAEDVVDTAENAVIIPEAWTDETARFHHATQLFWWLSVDNYLLTRKGPADAHDFLKKVIDPRAERHLVQSAYARDYLLKNGVSEDKITYLSDYINQTYLNHRKEAMQTEKEDLVLYNPKKGAEYVAELTKRAPDIPWRPIQGLSTIEAGALMRSAKVYIDFGNHPGKDRIPREAAMSGCIVITGRRGAAAFHEDVPIPVKYRLSEKTNSYEDVIRMIRESLAHYETLLHDFDDYRARIAEEKKQFAKDVRSLFFE